MNLETLSPGPDPPRVVHAVIEIPRGCRNKYEYDPEVGLFRLDRVLYSAVQYPTAYGFVPGTRGRDGDPIDVLVMTTEPTFSGCLIDARPVGLLRMRDEKGEDEKLLSVPSVDPRFDEIEGLDDVSSHLLREIEHFFRIYKELEGKQVSTFGWEGIDAAHAALRGALRARP